MSDDKGSGMGDVGKTASGVALGIILAVIIGVLALCALCYVIGLSYR